MPLVNSRRGRTRSIASSLLVFLAAVAGACRSASTPVPTPALVPPTSLRAEPRLPFPATRYERCRVALLILLDPPAGTRLIQTAGGLSACDQTSGYAVAALLGVHRTRSDTLLLAAVGLAAYRVPHAAVFEAGAEVAADSGASPAMRITALHAAYHSLMPGDTPGLHPDTLTWPGGRRQVTCSQSTVSHPPSRRGPMPPDAVVRLHALASRLGSDRGTAPALRDAAYCVAKRLLP